MATKRQAPDDRPSQSSAPQQSRKRFKPNNIGDFVPPANHGKKSFKKAHTTNSIKSTIRSLRRLLERDGLPADIRVEKERALQTAENELAATERAKVRSDMIARYHKPRFFERQKAERRLKQARKKLRAFEGEDEGERERLGRDVDCYEVDLNYALFFPLDEHYVSLYPTKRGEEEGVVAAAEERQGDKVMWELVRKCLGEGKNKLELLREGKLTQKAAFGEEEEEKEQVKASQKKVKRDKAGSGKGAAVKEKNSKKAVVEEEGRNNEESDDDDNGGGFFE
jgi:hypothetical protein